MPYTPTSDPDPALLDNGPTVEARDPADRPLGFRAWG